MFSINPNDVELTRLFVPVYSNARHAHDRPYLLSIKKLSFSLITFLWMWNKSRVVLDLVVKIR